MKNKYILIVFFAIINSVTIAVDLYDNNLTDDFFYNNNDDFFYNPIDSFGLSSDDDDERLVIYGQRLYGDPFTQTIYCDQDWDACQALRDYFSNDPNTVITQMDWLTEALIEGAKSEEEQKKLDKVLCYHNVELAQIKVNKFQAGGGILTVSACGAFWKTDSRAGLVCVGLIGLTGVYINANLNEQIAKEKLRCDLMP